MTTQRRTRRRVWRAHQRQEARLRANRERIEADMRRRLNGETPHTDLTCPVCAEEAEAEARPSLLERLFA